MIKILHRAKKRLKLPPRVKKRVRELLRTGGILLAVLLLFLLTRSAIGRLQGKVDRENQPEQNPGDIYYNGTWYALREDLETVLLVGVDKFADQYQEGIFTNDQQADFLMLLIVDSEKNVCHALPLNRDTMTQVDKLDLNGGVMDTQVEQLALAHTYGSGGSDSAFNTKRAVSQLLYGVPLNHYVCISMDAVGVLADAVDGVPVLVEQDFSTVTDQLPQDEVATLTDQLALEFVRARSSVGEGTNLERMSRQQQFIQAFYPRWLEKCDSEGDSFLRDVMIELDDYVTTDCSLQTLAQINSQISAYELILMDAPAGEAKKGEKYMEFYVDEDAMSDMVIELFYAKCE